MLQKKPLGSHKPNSKTCFQIWVQLVLQESKSHYMKFTAILLLLWRNFQQHETPRDLHGGQLTQGTRTDVPPNVRVLYPWDLAGVLRMGSLGDEKNPFWYPQNIGVNLGISHNNTLGSGYIQLSPETVVYKETMMTCSSDTNPPIPGWCFFHKHPSGYGFRRKKNMELCPAAPLEQKSEECLFSLPRNSFLLESHWQGVRIWTWTIVCPVRPWSLGKKMKTT